MGVIIVEPASKKLPPVDLNSADVNRHARVTEEWLLETIRVWQPYYKDPLTIQDAAEIIMNWNRLLDVLREEPAV